MGSKIVRKYGTEETRNTLRSWLKLPKTHKRTKLCKLKFAGEREPSGSRREELTGQSPDARACNEHPASPVLSQDRCSIMLETRQRAAVMERERLEGEPRSRKRERCCQNWLKNKAKSLLALKNIENPHYWGYFPYQCLGKTRQGWHGIKSRTQYPSSFFFWGAEGNL